MTDLKDNVPSGTIQNNIDFDKQGVIKDNVPNGTPTGAELVKKEQKKRVVTKNGQFPDLWYKCGERKYPFILLSDRWVFLLSGWQN